MSNLVHGIDLSAVATRKNGSRVWPPELRKRIVTLMKTVPIVQLGKDLKIHPVQLYQWRRDGPAHPRAKASASTRSKGTARPTRKGAAKVTRRGPYKKRKAAQEVDVSLPETAGIVAALRKKHQSLVETAAHVLATIGFYENGGGPVETVRLSDAQVEEKPRRQISKAGKAAISKAAKKRWAIYNRNKNKKKK